MSKDNESSEVEIDGVVYSYRCDICWQELDDTDIQFKPCNRCHLQVCLFCFNKHTNQKESYAKTCPKCRQPIDMDQIILQNMKNSKNKDSVGKKLLKKKRKRSKNTAKLFQMDNNKNVNYAGTATDSSTTTTANSVDIDEEIPKSEWKNYLKGRFISRDSIIVSPVIAKFNHEDAISDNFKAYGKITRINMWDDESAHIMYDKQYYADALVDKIQDVAVRYQGQFGLMSAKYHFRRPCEEYMNPDRRCPMQCRKFHGPYYKLDFIPLDTYLDEETREQWTNERKKCVSSIVKGRYKKFRKKYMEGMPLPIMDEQKEKKTQNNNQQNDGYYGYDYNEDEYDEYNRSNYNRFHHQNGGNNNNKNNNWKKKTNQKIAVTLNTYNMGKANRRLAADDSLRKHMKTRPKQPLPPSRPPPPVPAPIVMMNEDTKSIKSVDSKTSTASSTVSVSKRTRPPISHTTSAQMRPFMTDNPNLFYLNEQQKQKIMAKAQKLQRTKSEDAVNSNLNASISPLRSTKSDSMSSNYVQRKEKRYLINGHSHNRGDSFYNVKVNEVDNEKQIISPSAISSPKQTTKTVDLLKSLKKKKRRKQQQISPNRVVSSPPNLTAITPMKHSNHTLAMNHSVSPMNGFYAKQFGGNQPMVHPFAAHQNVKRIEKENVVNAQPNDVVLTPNSFNPKKSKLNANAASYKPSKLSLSPPKKQSQPQQNERTKSLQKTQMRQPTFKMPKIGNNTNNDLKSFDFRNLGSLISDNDILNRNHKDYAYDFGAALNECHLEQIQNDDYKQAYPQRDDVSSDDSSDEEEGKLKWNEESLWSKVCQIVKEQKLTQRDIKWQNIRRILKSQMTTSDWMQIKKNKLIKKMKAKFRIEFEQQNDDQSDGKKVENLLKKQKLRTSEANSFCDLKFDECTVIDLDLRISDIRNYMTDLLVNNTASVPSQYDTTIIAELGQILNIYQSWIDIKKSNKMETHQLQIKTQEEEMEDNEIEELFGTPAAQLCLNDDKSKSVDFYSRLLDEVKEKAMNDHDYYSKNENMRDVTKQNPKNLVMDYIGFETKETKKEQVKVVKEENVEIEDTYDDDLYEYSDDSEDELVKAEEINAYDEEDVDTGSHKEAEDDLEDDLLMDSIVLNGQLDVNKVYISPSTEPNDEDEDDEDALYQYDDEEEDENDDEHIGSPIFSRVNSPPPRHRNHMKEVDKLFLNPEQQQKNKNNEEEQEENVYDYDDDEDENEQQNNEFGDDLKNGIQREHYYNARYPPRRGRYGRNMNMESNGSGNTNYYRPRYVNGNSQALIKKKMEWKKKEIANITN